VIRLEDGFPERTRDLAAQADAFEWESKGLRDRDDCSAQLGVSEGCLSNGRPHQIAVVGDSFSKNVFFMQQELHRDDGKGVLRLGTAGCLPFYEVGEERCRDAMNRNLDYVMHEPDITTIVLSLRESLYIGAAARSRPIPEYDTRSQHNLDLFRAGMTRTIERLSGAGKQVVFALGWPELTFDPKACVDVRPLRFRHFAESNCTMDRREVEERSAGYRRIVMDVLAKFPTARYWDPIPLLCDERMCYAKRDGVLLYRDKNHLSLAGSEYLGRSFATEAPPRPDSR
jgi:hypothetical protein